MSFSHVKLKCVECAGFLTIRNHCGLSDQKTENGAETLTVLSYNKLSSLLKTSIKIWAQNGNLLWSGDVVVRFSIMVLCPVDWSFPMEKTRLKVINVYNIFFMYLYFKYTSL